MNGEQQPNRKKIDPSSVMAVLFLVGVAVALPVFLWSTCSSTSPLREETRAFFGRIHDGKMREAYDHLAAARRKQLSFETFSSQFERPVFQRYESATVAGTQSHDDEWGCTRGDLELGGRDWTFELYLVKEGQAWHVHTWVVDEPATMARLNKLSQCRQW